jgi:hypothetical protein
MQNMLPGNSFPQICVVSVTHILSYQRFAQDYGRSMDLSNTLCGLIGSGPRALCWNLAEVMDAGVRQQAAGCDAVRASIDRSGCLRPSCAATG